MSNTLDLPEAIKRERRKVRRNIAVGCLILGFTHAAFFAAGLLVLYLINP